MGGKSSKEEEAPKVRQVAPGVTVETLKEGDGKTYAREYQNVNVHYTGTLDNGTVFDSSHHRNEPFQFAVGAGQVIKCWDKGVAAMSLGEKARLTCAPEVAYGPRGIGPIPPNSELTFDVELLKLY
eukprot:TRINITY_DN30312_c0_g1_i1.p1 TRINITY_DN30312_c0_g1~~TRINITY_DN30312_c0_g1_i1.p1  ORF type:complete len:126 (+),score=15.16 TRINITY_DN30312_c0_g1_i1:40-417(+)